MSAGVATTPALLNWFAPQATRWQPDVRAQVVGCAVFGAVVVKVAAVRSRRAPGWFLPVAGRLLFALLITVVLTPAVWHLSENGWPGGGGGY